MVDISNLADLTLEDLILSPDQLENAPTFTKSVIKKDYEVVYSTEEEEVLVRDLRETPYRRMAQTLVDIYLRSKPGVDYLAQNAFHLDYLAGKYHLPWLIPIVQDQKMVYKKKYSTKDQTTQLIETKEMMANLNQNVVNFVNTHDSQALAEAVTNYRPLPSNNLITNTEGQQALRLNAPLEELTQQDSGLTQEQVALRGAYPARRVTRVIQEKKTLRKEVVVGKESIPVVSGEQLNVVGFARLNPDYPQNFTGSGNWFAQTRLVVKPTDQEAVLREFLPGIDQLLTSEKIDFTGFTDLGQFINLFKVYGHSLLNLSSANRNLITLMIESNINQVFKPPEEVVRTDRLEFPHLEKILISDLGSGILTKSVLEHPALIKFNTDFSRIPNPFYQYLAMIYQLDNGQIWTTLIKKGVKPQEIEEAVNFLMVVAQNREQKRSLLNSYTNLLAKTMPNPSLFERTNNPLDNILEIRQEKRDQIAWFQYYKKAVPDRIQQNLIFRGRYLGCQHDYDRLYQMFEDSNDPYPFGKRYTRITPFQGVICNFCGETLIEDNHLTDQGYDSRGQRINTYDNDPLIRESTLIDRFLKGSNKDEVIRNGEKLVEHWVKIRGQSMSTRNVRTLKYTILSTYHELILNAKYFIGLQQDPNKLLALRETQFASWLVKEFKIENFNRRDNMLILQALFKFFYNLASIHQLVIQRLAVFLLVLNWKLSQEDPVFLDPRILLSYYNLGELGMLFLNYNLKSKNMIIGLENPQAQQFFDFYQEKIGDQKLKPEDFKSVQERQKALKSDFENYRLALLYRQGQKGLIFDGTNSLTHEIIRIFDLYLASLDRPTTSQLLENNLLQIWAEWIKERPSEVSRMRQNAKIVLIPDSKILSDQTPRIRPLRDQYLAQKAFLLRRKLDRVYQAFVETNFSQIWGDELEGLGGDQIRTKISILVNKLKCDDWTTLDQIKEFSPSLIESAGDLQIISALKEELVEVLETIAVAGFGIYWIPAGGFLYRNYDKRDFTLFRGYEYQHRDLVEIIRKEIGKDGKLKISQQIKLKKELKLPRGFTPSLKTPYPFEKLKSLTKFEERKAPKIAKDDIPDSVREFLAKDLAFLKNLQGFLETMGKVDYVQIMIKANKDVYQLVNGQGNGAEFCNQPAKIEEPYPSSEEFEQDYRAVAPGQYSASRIRLSNLKRHILTNFRQTIAQLSRVESREKMVELGLEAYLPLFEHSEMNLAFQGFYDHFDDDLGRFFTNQEIEELVSITMAKNSEKGHLQMVDQLQRMMITDLVRQVRMVRTRSGKLKTKPKARRTDEMSAIEIFTEFAKILFREMIEEDKVNNVSFSFYQENRNFAEISLFKRMRTAEKRSEIEYKILKYQIKINEIQEEINAQGDDPSNLVTELADDEFDLPDTENDEDDTYDHDYNHLSS